MTEIGKAKTQDREVELSPFLDVPEGLELFVRNQELENTDLTEGGQDDSADPTVKPPGEILPPVSGGKIRPPTGFQVKSQQLVTAPDGSQSVDVVVTFDEAAGAVDYDVKVSTSLW